jgi:uncharacterized protein DUF1631
MAKAPVFELKPNSASANPAPGLQQASQFEDILEQSRNLICERLDQAVAAMLNDAKDALTKRINETRNFEERRLYEETRAAVTTQREVMEKQFRSNFLGEFRRRADRARKIGAVSGAEDDSLGQLSLVGEDDFEETLKFNNMAGKLGRYCDEELVALDQRVGVLLGDANLSANDNPFSPQVICDAYKQACRAADAGIGVRGVLLKLFDDHVLDDVRSMYKDVNALLVQNSILPKIRYGVSRSPSSPGRKPSPGAPAGEGAQAPASDITTAAAQDLFAVLQNLAAMNAVAMGPQGVFRGGGAAGAPGPAGAPGLPAAAGGDAPALQGAELQSSLTRIQMGDLAGVSGGALSAPTTGVPGTTNVLRELRTTSVGAGMGSLDLMIDIISMLFDQIFDDPKVPNGVKGLIGRLQIPMLKVAIADKTFFSTKTHPARRLLDTLGDVAARLPADFGPAAPLFARLQSVLDELVEGFKDDLGIFDTTRERVEALLSEEDRRIEQETLANAKRLEEMETLAVAKRAAAEEVKARVQSRKLPGPVLEFLVQQWLKLLLLVLVREGKDSDAWKGAVETMDLLIWSIEPRSTNEERRKVAAVIPGLLKKLAAGMKAAGVEGRARNQFFAHLIRYHRAAITVPEDKPDPAPAAEAETGQPEGALQTAAPAEAQAADSGSLDFTAPVTIKNPFGEGDVNVESLDLDFTVHETGGGRAQRDAAANPLANLVIGVWVEFRESQERIVRRPGRLIFMTPRKTRYLFAFDRTGKDILPYTPGELNRRFRIGEAVFIDEPRLESLFDRVMKGLIGRLRVPAQPGRSS